MRRKVKATYNFQVCYRSYRDRVTDSVLGVLMEGGSRSGKTYAACQFIVHYIRANTGKVITIGRDTRVNLKATLWVDFKEVLVQFGIYDKCKINLTDFTLSYNDNLIRFIGVNDDIMKAHGLAQDLFWLNEAMNISKDTFDQMQQRTTEFFICDYNPSKDESWLYDLADNKNIRWYKSTVLDNPFVPELAKRKILSYEPTAENIANKTANAYNWKIYGKGERGASEDTIFPEWSTFEVMPTGFDYEFYGGDFGFADPSTVVHGVIDGSNLYLQEVLWGSGLGKNEMGKMLLEYKKTWDQYIVFDSAEPGSITDLRMMGLPAIGAAKGRGSVVFGIDAIKNYNILVHESSKNLQSEFKNYKWKKGKDGNHVYLGKKRVPSDTRDKNGVKYDHGIAAIRYGLTKFIHIQPTNELD